MPRPLNATAASLLGFLHDQPMSGWDLVRTAEERIGDFWSLTRSQVYRELAAMAEAGFIEAGETGPRDRRPYALTDAGREAFAEWLAQDPGRETIRYPLLLWMSFASQLPEERLHRILREHRAEHATRLAGYEAAQASILPEAFEADPYGLAVLDFGLTYERAVLDWFNRLLEARAG
jgi:DNA-binding PadR family transcriptional regulator